MLKLTDPDTGRAHHVPVDKILSVNECDPEKAPMIGECSIWFGGPDYMCVRESAADVARMVEEATKLPVIPWVEYPEPTRFTPREG